MANIAERLDLALRKRGYSGAQVAAELTRAGIPITRAYVSQLRTGKQTNPTLQVLRALAACLQVSVGWLVGEEHAEPGAERIPRPAGVSGQIGQIGQSAAGLSDTSLDVVRDVIGLARRAEGLSEPEPGPEPEPEILEIPEAAAVLTDAQRAALGRRLRGLRLAVLMSPEQVETALGRGKAAIEAIEAGAVAPAPATVELLLDLYGVTPLPVREHVLSLARAEREPVRWDDDSVPVWLAAAYALEQRASVIRTYHPQLVPALLQTDEYARAAIALAGPATLGQDSLDAAARLAPARQKPVTEGGPVVWAIMDESALLRSIAEPHVHLTQLETLLEYAKRPHISLHVVPIQDPAYLPRTGPFTLWRFPEAFEPDIACAHSAESDELITDSAAVEAYHQAFTKLSVTTTTREETLDLLYTHRDRIARG
ncbi:Scr1 family TA system antitoxin-like transcriptional regulator [Nonomuraea sp. NPDC048916]|uniref:Scr1 family TA system antitoxin-like transcriptional regulator n=1 Tax=Nonomuraea sp. NPDC048916 TaxID=3154232 RepID=UPI0033E0FBF7